MDRSSSLNRWTVVDTVSYLMIGSVAGRMLPYYLPTADRWLVVGLLALYLLLFTAARFFVRRFSQIAPIYFLLQAVITVVLNLVIPSYDGPQDYFVMLILPLCIQATWQLPPRAGTLWVAGFALTMAASMVFYYLRYENSWEGIGYGLAYVAGCIMVSAFSGLTVRAERVRRETQALNAELQAANQKLQDYARQVEQLAAAEERARLARDLHDSVSQTIFSMTLTAQSARILLDRDPARVPAQLAHLQDLAGSALAEMRSLIQHMRPASLERDGLAACLRRHILERKVQDGLVVDLTITGERRLPAEVEEGLFRVVQEALNNVVKHAGVCSASISLDLSGDDLDLCVADHGSGFDPAAARSPGGAGQPGHLGLAGMAERVQALGGTLAVESAPGQGTRVWVRGVRIAEENYA